jgi:hypothetical protein
MVGPDFDEIARMEGIPLASSPIRALIECRFKEGQFWGYDLCSRSRPMRHKLSFSANSCQDRSGRGRHTLWDGGNVRV